ncbi:MAG: RpiB/LacA/LacB family sugar-phosphate isomerase [Bdellovibrionaceae bacterium]|nr:RpiB/LacA/LacB family sugar-phosphate isomerase [Pseudobdellovibrionaceae bacterium]
MKKILIASDHAAYDLKQQFIKNNPDLPWEDLGPANADSVDYPDYAKKLCAKLIELTGRDPITEDAFNSGICGILICGSGQGMAIAANKYPQIRAALCWNEDVAKLSRNHNNANVLCLGSRDVTPEIAQKILTTFLGSAFEGGRHSQRVAKIALK